MLVEAKIIIAQRRCPIHTMCERLRPQSFKWTSTAESFHYLFREIGWSVRTTPIFQTIVSVMVNVTDVPRQCSVSWKEYFVGIKFTSLDGSCLEIFATTESLAKLSTCWGFRSPMAVPVVPWVGVLTFLLPAFSRRFIEFHLFLISLSARFFINFAIVDHLCINGWQCLISVGKNLYDDVYTRIEYKSILFCRQQYLLWSESVVKVLDHILFFGGPLSLFQIGPQVV